MSAMRIARSRRRPERPSSRISNSGSRPAAGACARRTRAQKEWKVPTNAASVSRAASRSPSSSRRARTRSRSSPAARSVNVIASIRPGWMPSRRTARTNRSTSTSVLPLPAAADSSSGSARRSAARSCSSVSARAEESAATPAPRVPLMARTGRSSGTCSPRCMRTWRAAGPDLLCPPRRPPAAQPAVPPPSVRAPARDRASLP